MLNHFRRIGDGDGYYAVRILDHLQAGVTADDVADRRRILAAKTRRLFQSDHARYEWLGIEALALPRGSIPGLSCCSRTISDVSCPKPGGGACLLRISWNGWGRCRARPVNAYAVAPWRVPATSP